MVQERQVAIGTGRQGRLVLRRAQTSDNGDRQMVATLETGLLKATIQIHESMTGTPEVGDFAGLAALFEFMAENWRGWEGERGWRSVDDDLRLSATADSLGHCTLTVRVRDFIERWEATGPLHLDAGQLTDLAGDVGSFIRALRATAE
jgi:hypothetical protein